MTEESLISFDKALAELQMATRELRDLIARGDVAVEGHGLDLNFRRDTILQLKEELVRKRSEEPPIPEAEIAKGWAQRGGIITWQGTAPEDGWIMHRAGKHKWDRMKFRFYFDARGTLAKVGLAAGQRVFVVETRRDPDRWHSFLMHVESGEGTIVVNDEERFSGRIEIPYLALCGGGPSELSRAGQDRLSFRGARLKQIET